MAFGNLKIGARLGAGFVALLLMQLLVTGIGLRQMAAISDQLNFITDVGDAKLKALSDVQAAIGLRAIAARNLALVADPNAQRGDVELVKTSQAQIDKGMQQLGTLIKDPASGSDDERQMLDQLRSLEAKYLPIAGNVVALATTQKTAEAIKALTQDCMPLLTQVIAHVGAFEKVLKKDSDSAATAAQATYQRAKWTILLISAVSLAAGVAIALWLTRSITRPLGEAVQVAQRVAAGDLGARIETSATDETGQLLNALRQMTDSLASVVGNVRNASDSIATGSAEIASGNNDLSARTEQQASALEQTAASMEELSSTVKQNADNARQGNQLAMSASSVAVKGGEVVGQVVQTMKGINDSSRKIADIIQVIDGIAFQTNILALNAAVEAARAGEQGRGFAVVASEVRSLAGRSADAAKEIKALITDSVERVGQGTALVDQAGATMTEVVSSIKRVTDIMGEISAASTEQSAGVAQVGEAVTQMDQATQQNAALVEQSAAAAESLKAQAQQLVQAVAVFKLGHPNEGFAGASAQAPAPAPAPAQVSFPKVERRGPKRSSNVARLTPKAAPELSTLSSRVPTRRADATEGWAAF